MIFNYIKLVIILSIVVFFNTNQIKTQSNDLVLSFLESQIIIDADEITSSEIKEILSAELFKVKRIKKYETDGSFELFTLAKHKGKIFELEYANQLEPMLNENFNLNSELEAQKLQKIFSKLFPSDKRKQQIIKKENQWIFIQREWFNKKVGFIVTTNKNGKITKIEESEEL